MAQCVWVRWWLVRRALPNVALRTPCGGVMGALILVLTWMVGCGDGRAGPCAIAFVPLCTAACCSCPLVSRLRTVSVPRCGIHTGLALYASHNGAGHCFGTFKSYSVLDFMCATTVLPVRLFGRCGCSSGPATPHVSGASHLSNGSSGSPVSCHAFHVTRCRNGISPPLPFGSSKSFCFLGSALCLLPSSGLAAF